MPRTPNSVETRVIPGCFRPEYIQKMLKRHPRIGSQELTARVNTENAHIMKNRAKKAKSRLDEKDKEDLAILDVFETYLDHYIKIHSTVAVLCSHIHDRKSFKARDVMLGDSEVRLKLAAMVGSLRNPSPVDICKMRAACANETTSISGSKTKE